MPPMPPLTHEEIYAQHAAEYDELVSAEDCDGNLIPALEQICPLRGARVLELGIGTARIARQILDRVAYLVGVDRAPAMLEVARARLSALSEVATWELLAADARDLPLAAGWADLAVAGWVFGHFREWMPANWKDELGRALAELSRVLAPGGVIVLIETLGTGATTPQAPTPGLAEYYEHLEAQGFARVAIRTDYRFADVQTAARITGFFFGEAFAARVLREGWARVPECTGLWWRRAAAVAAA